MENYILTVRVCWILMTPNPGLITKEKYITQRLEKTTSLQNPIGYLMMLNRLMRILQKRLLKAVKKTIKNLAMYITVGI